MKLVWSHATGIRRWGRRAVLAVAVIAAALWVAPSAVAHTHVGFGISIGVGNCWGCGYWSAAPPVYYTPAYPRVYRYPPVVYYSPPAYYGYGYVGRGYRGYYAPYYHRGYYHHHGRYPYARRHYGHRGWHHGHGHYYRGHRGHRGHHGHR